jgi:hypothetical protein
MKWGYIVVTMAPLLAGCASSADDIGSTYISPVMYESLSCQQLAAEAQNVSSRAAVATGAQNKKRTTDAVVTTVGLVVFWPSLFFIQGNGQQAAELANLKGQMDAIEQASIRKNCGIQFQREAPVTKQPIANAPGNSSLRKAN